MSNYKAYLRKQPNFDEITGYIYFGQDRIRYPDRSATILRDSPYLGIYDGIGTHELEEQEEQVEKAKLMQAKAREVAKKEEETHQPPSPRPGGTYDPPLPPEGGGGGPGIKGGIPPKIKQPLPIKTGGPVPLSLKDDDPLGTKYVDPIPEWHEAMEEQDNAIAIATKQNEERIHDEVNKKMLNKALDAVKNTAGVMYRHADMELAGAVADAAAKTVIAGAAVTGVYLLASTVATAAVAYGLYQGAVGVDKLINAIKGSEIPDDDVGGSSSSSSGKRRNRQKEDRVVREKFTKTNEEDLRKQVFENPEIQEFIEFLPDEEAKENARESINRAGKPGLIKLLVNLTTGVARTMVNP